MIARLDLRGSRADPRDVLPRAQVDVEAALETVRPIVADVRDRGADAVLEWGERLDGVRPPSLRVPVATLQQALADLDPQVRAALEESIRRARLVHADQRRTDTTTQVVPGGTVTERWVPVERVGLYVPGGRAVYPSSVVMNVVPAQVAGVASLAVASPPQRDSGGLPHPTILAACALLGVDEVYAAGGAQAVAMFAYGAGECRPVGDGHRARATSTCRGQAAAQGPHRHRRRGRPDRDRRARRRLRRPGARRRRPDQPGRARRRRGLGARHRQRGARRRGRGRAGGRRSRRPSTSERVAEALSGPQSRDRARRRPGRRAGRCRRVRAPSTWRSRPATRRRSQPGCATRARSSSARGRRSRSATTCAGSNHVLPTGGCACHSSGLSVQTFLRGIHVVDYDERALRARPPTTSWRSSHAEDLPAHGAGGPGPVPGVRAAGARARRAAGPRGPARSIAVRRAPAGRAGAPQRQREPLRPQPRARGGRGAGGRRRRCRAEPLPRP